MSGSALPPGLAAARDRLLEGVSRRELREQASALSQRYRGASGAHARASELLAYVVTRMPATYAAVAAALEELRARVPGFAPASLLDLGSGPGTACWAAAMGFDTIGSVTAIDRDPNFQDLAKRLAADHPLLSQTTQIKSDLETLPPISDRYDLVVAAFTLAELAREKLSAVIANVWAATAEILVLVEPGTPAGVARILQARGEIVGLGGRVIAPCPHDRACPLAGDDWCHFAVRLPRERDHRAVKGATVPFEDEKYAYVIVGREQSPPIRGRILRPPRVTKAETIAALCTPEGLSERHVAARDRDAYRTSQKWRWGMALEE